MTDENEKMKKRFFELADRAATRRATVCSDFLTLDEQNLLHNLSFSVPLTLDGGFDCAERRVACFGEPFENEHTSAISCIEIKPVAPKFADTLSHRDFLGTLMGLGIKRETIGDIIIYENTGYVFCLEKIAGYIVENVDRIKHTSVKSLIVQSPPVQSVAQPTEQIIIVASERLDALVAAVYKLSRSSAQELFEQQKIFINGKMTVNSSYSAKDDDIISVRGVGRFIFCGTAGETKKSRLKIKVRIF